MSAAAVEPLTHVLARFQQVLGAGREADEGALSVAVRFLRGEEPTWLRRRPDAVRLDVLVVCELLARRRG
ncbi:hypothetical protein GCM10011381_11840 [Klenkia taihuensis]|uniref:Uncharacterized protein n=1 Tax=Klenkia taihuensis TaxID=1225127 RepID=A0A1I1HUZ6_9ACTN|nr:hypothetical protein GCM10011381_11840 [Klenkia taihuensis]SFC27754.1 hypothetical protein SAMN05661030_0552 [Klenkia taihuensis]